MGVSRIYYLHVWLQHIGQMSLFLVSAIQEDIEKLEGIQLRTTKVSKKRKKKENMRKSQGEKSVYLINKASAACEYL